MRVLFVVGKVSPAGDANTNVVGALLSGMTGHEVSVLSIDDPVTKTIVSKWRGCRLHQVSTLSRYGKLRYSSSAGVRARTVVTNPGLFASYLAARLRSLSPRAMKLHRARLVRAGLADLVKREKFDAVIAVSEPFETCIALARLRTEAKKVFLELDPFASKQLAESIAQTQWRAALERRVEQKADIILLTRLMYEERRAAGANLSESNCHVLEFPLIRDHGAELCHNGNLGSADRLTCVFLGQLYPGIREPSYVLEVLSRVNVECDVYFVGPGCEVLGLERHPTRGLVRFHGIGRQPLDRALSIMNDASVLINIGNAAANQMPSKILDYISTGSPILNFHKLRECPTLEYTKRYPLALDVLESDGDLLDTVQRVESFLTMSRGKRLPFTEIERIFSANTPRAVCERMIRLVSESQ